MRVLHFTNIPFDVEQLRTLGKSISGSGGWMAALLGRMMSEKDIQLAVASLDNVPKIQVSRDERIECYRIPRGRFQNRQSQKFGLSNCLDLIRNWQPDIIHIHGTENLYGLLSARGMIDCPAVISLQGLIGPSSEWYHYFGNRSLIDVAKMHRWLEFPTLRGHWRWFLGMRESAYREREIIVGNKFFLGRTEWDRAYLFSLNPSAIYYHSGELLREPFWQSQWRFNKFIRNRIIIANANHPRKGAEILFDAVRILKEDFPDIQIAIAGFISRRSGYGQYMQKQLRDLGSIVVELGQLNAEEMAEELAKSHIFASPSFIDNSPNAVCEAQLVGLPVISTYTGGLPSLIEHGKTGLFFPVGDAPMLASRIKQVFMDDSLSMMLSDQARVMAQERHDSDIIVSEVLMSYEDAMAKW